MFAQDRLFSLSEPQGVFLVCSMLLVYSRFATDQARVATLPFLERLQLFSEVSR